MAIKVMNYLFVLFLLININSTYAENKIFVEKYEKWTHPILYVFKNYGISVYKVKYSKDGTCPTFYAKFKTAINKHNPRTGPLKNMYWEAIKANYLFPYSLIDKERGMRINIGWKDKSKGRIDVDIDKATSNSTCLVDDSKADATFYVSSGMKKRILNSPFKTSMQGDNGKKLTAYLYAEDVRKKLIQQTLCSEEKETTFMSQTGHYHIYLYDINSDSFYRGRTHVFDDKHKITMGIDGAQFFTLHNSNKHKADALLISQSKDNCYGDWFEAYGLSENNTSLKKLAFVGAHRISIFYGKIGSNDKKSKLVAYGHYISNEIQKIQISLSNKPKEIRLSIPKNRSIIVYGWGEDTPESVRPPQ